MPVQMRPAQIDFSALANLGQIPERLRQRQLRSEMRALVGPDGTIDWNKAYAVLAKNDPILGLKLQADREGAQALNAYRTAQAGAVGVPEDVRLLEWAQRNHPEWLGGNSGSGGVEPFRLGPDSAQPPAMFDKFRPSAVVEREKAEAKAAGEATGERAATVQKAEFTAAKAQSAIDDLVANVEATDPRTLGFALGPWQGQPDAESWQGATGQLLPQTVGTIQNSLISRDPRYQNKTTSEVRSMMHGKAATLVNILKPYIRAKGEGAQSDRELAVIQQQVGELFKANTKEEFYRRLKEVTSNIKALGINVSIPGQEEPAMDMGAPLPGDSPVVRGPQPRRVKTETIPAPTQAGASAPPVTTDTPKIQKGSPEERQMLQWANEAIQQGADPQAVIQRLREMGIEQ